MPPLTRPVITMPAGHKSDGKAVPLTRGQPTSVNYRVQCLAQHGQPTGPFPNPPHRIDSEPTFGKDIVENGEIGEAGYRFAQEKLGMSEQSVQDIYADMQEAGAQVMADFMEVGDGFGFDRIDFLVEKAESGTQREQAIIRNLWFMAATGKLSRQDAADAFDHLYKPYAA